MPLKFEWIPDAAGTSKTGLVAALVGQFVTVPTAEVPCAGGKIESADTPSTVNAIDAQQADKPVTHSTEMAGGGSDSDLVVVVGLVSIPVRDGLIDLDVRFSRYVHKRSYAVCLTRKPPRPG